MIEGDKYFESVKEYYLFLIDEFGYTLFEVIENGNVFYSVRYRTLETEIAISYENFDDVLEIVIYKIKNGRYFSSDDKPYTWHLNDLNKIVLPEIGIPAIEKNAAWFKDMIAADTIQKKLLKSAKELRLVLAYGMDLIK